MTAQDLILATKTYAGVSAMHPGVEVWPDGAHPDDGHAYFWLVSRHEGTVRNVAYLRVRLGEVQKRIYDAEGDDLWVAAE